MEFELTYTPEQEAFRTEARRWLADHVPPDLNRRPDSHEDSHRLYLERRALGRELGALGWLYPSAPKEYGGAGLSLDEVIILEEESHRLALTLPPYYDSGGKLGGATILVWGTEEQKAKFLPPIFTGEVRTWQLLSEPGAGSDLASVKTTALRRGDGYVINGQKVFVGSAHGAERLWIIAVTDPAAKRHHNVSWFMIDAGLAGITIQPQVLLSNHGEGEADIGHKNTIYFDDVVVPADALVGGENNGWRVAATHLELEHGARGNVRRNRIWDRVLSHYGEDRSARGAMLTEADEQEALAEIYIRLETVRLLGARNFWLNSTGAPVTYEGSQLAYVQKTTGLWLTGVLLDLLGPAALTDDGALGALDGFAELQQRDGIVDMHPGGTTDVQRLIMARRMGVGGRGRGAVDE
jgi:alkylation response protein AidB-like acyl-CoA dehydrogenase